MGNQPRNLAAGQCTRFENAFTESNLERHLEIKDFDSRSTDTDVDRREFFYSLINIRAQEFKVCVDCHRATI